MSSDEKVEQADLATLAVIRYPDPRLREVCTPLEEVDDRVRALAERMFQLMFEARGVGLAAPQVGVTVRMFAASPSFQADDRGFYINPTIIAVDGVQEGEEGCLSFPAIAAKVKRKNIVTVRAIDLNGRQFEQTGEGLLARIIQHESDHLDGRLLVDRMGSVARLANRRALKELEEEFATSQAT